MTKLADLHFVATNKAAERVIRMGEQTERVHVTGCPSIDLVAELLSQPVPDINPSTAFGGIGPELDTSGDYIVAIQHPVTTEYEEALAHIDETLKAVAEVGVPAFWFWPNVDAGSDGTSKGIRMFRERHRDINIHFFRNIGPEDFLRLARNSRAVVGNLSFGIREASYLGLPVVNIGSRQEGRERGENVTDADYDQSSIQQALLLQLAHGPYASNQIYGDGHAGEKIASFLSNVAFTIEKKLAIDLSHRRRWPLGV